MMDYTVNDRISQKEMLKVIGVDSIDQLYKDIPKDLRIDHLLLPEGLSEPELLQKLTDLSQKNKQYRTSFMGAGSYYHYLPSLVDFVISRSQFYSSYTPYQAEASQGMLQAIYEYQSVISRLTEMDVTNASMYDGATACAEACTMAHFYTRKSKLLLIEGLHPEYIDTIKTYLWGRNLTWEIIPIDQLEEKLDDEIAGVIFQSPNFFGDIEDVPSLVNVIRAKYTQKKCVIIQAMADPTVLGKLSPPGKNGIDIFVSEGMGLPPSFGGPNLGIFSVTDKLMRKMPGRIIGMTKEIDGDKKGFVLTLQAREQHIRREKALSNICSNQSLCMLACLVYLVSLGKTGLEQVATQNFQKAHFLNEAIRQIPGYKILNSKPTYNEFTIECPNVELLSQKCKEANILPPLRLSRYYPERTNQMLVCVTENNSKGDLTQFIQIAKEAGI